MEQASTLCVFKHYLLELSLHLINYYFFFCLIYLTVFSWALVFVIVFLLFVLCAAHWPMTVVYCALQINVF